MPSPFPGMDPYLEDPAFWQDFHGRMIYSMSEQLLDRLPGHYDAAVEERVSLIEGPEDGDESRPVGRDIRSDVAVPQNTNDPSPAPSPAAGAATLEPVTVRVPVIEAEIRERWIEIRRGEKRKLVTVIELLSPGNKAGSGFGRYQTKRAALLRQRIHLLELDLLIGGRLPDPEHLLPVADYYALLTRAGRPSIREIYAWSIRRVLPTVPVPLAPGDPDIPLDLAAALAEAYERGRYGRRLSYDAPPTIPLDEVDGAWASGIVQEKKQP